jgi:predicted MFS family arabinose efflux permease
VLAILLGPLIDAYIGLSGLFALTALLAGGGLLLLLLVRSPSELSKLSDLSKIPLGAQIRALFKRRDLWCVNIAIFILHAILIAIFLLLPSKIQAVSGLVSTQVWRFYLPVLAFSLILVAPLLRYADHKKWQKPLLFSAMGGLSLAIIMLLFATKMAFLVTACTVFFLAFNFLEAALPSLVSKLAPKASKGSALGVYSCAQFLGMFVGGALGGCLQQEFGAWGVGIFCIVLAAVGGIVLRKLTYPETNYVSQLLNEEVSHGKRY